MSLNPYQPPRQLTDLPEDVVVATPAIGDANEVSLWMLSAIVGVLALFMATAVATIFGAGLLALLAGIFYGHNVEMPRTIFALVMLVAICGGASVALTTFQTVVFGSGRRAIVLVPAAAWLISMMLLIIAVMVELL